MRGGGRRGLLGRGGVKHKEHKETKDHENGLNHGGRGAHGEGSIGGKWRFGPEGMGLGLGFISDLVFWERGMVARGVGNGVAWLLMVGAVRSVGAAVTVLTNQIGYDVSGAKRAVVMGRDGDEVSTFRVLEN